MKWTEAVKCLRKATNYAPMKGYHSSTKKFFEKPAPSGEAVMGEGTLIVTRPGTSETQTFCRRMAWKGGQDNECPYVCKSQNCKRKLDKHYGT